MAPHSSTLAWKIPWTGEPGGLQSMGSLSQTWLSNFTFTFHLHTLEKEMVTRSSVLAWRIPGMAEPGGLPSMGSHRVGHDWLDLAAAATFLPVTLSAGTAVVFQMYIYIGHFKKDVQLESCEVSFMWGNMRTVAQEAPSQIALRDRSKAAVGESQYIRFLVKGEFNTMKQSFYKRFFVSHENLMSPWRDLVLL